LNWSGFTEDKLSFKRDSIIDYIIKIQVGNTKNSELSSIENRPKVTLLLTIISEKDKLFLYCCK